MRRRLGDKWGIAYSLDSLGLIARGQRRLGGRAPAFAECLALFHDLGSQRRPPTPWITSRACWPTKGPIGPPRSSWRPRPPSGKPSTARSRRRARGGYEQQLASIRAQLSDDDFRAAWTLGSARRPSRRCDVRWN